VTTRIYATLNDAIAAAGTAAHAPLVRDPGSHLLSRFAFGPSAEDRANLTKVGMSMWWRQQISYGTTYRGYSGNSYVANACPLLAKSPWDVRQWLKANGDEYGWDAMDQLTQATLGLQAWSKAQLYETLVDFFANHLNVANHNGDVWNTRHAFDRDVIRKYAMGSYTDMLLASSKHPAMLIYLNQADSDKNNVNENYGRELLELHSVGLIYSESDVKNAAKVLTGRTVDDFSNYHYDLSNHYVGPVQVLGWSHANSTAAGGEAAADALVKYLAANRYTAKHLATKLCLRFVSDTPSGDLVNAVARAYLDNGTQILPMLSVIIHSNEFWASRGAKVRRPAENLIATVRIIGNRPSNTAQAINDLHWMSYNLGQVPLDWPTPDGYPDVASKWRSSSTLLTMWQNHLAFADDWLSSFKSFDKSSLYGRTPTSSGDAINLLTKRLTGMTFSTAHRAALQAFLGEPSTTSMADSRLRWMLNPLIAVILDGPHHALR
jgi:Protein of unknown function (DUF1800)